MNNVFKLPMAVALSAAAFTTVSVAQDWYGSGQIAWLDQSSSTNTGVFNADFTTGNSGGVIPTGTVIASDAPLNFRTRFDDGFSGALEVGRGLEDITGIKGLRGALEIVYTKSDVDGHSAVTADGVLLDGADVSVLTGDPATSGVTVGETLGAARGNIQNTAAFVNLYKDFGGFAGIKPYVGVGVGVTEAHVKYNPSDVNVVKDDAVKFAWQAKVGASRQLYGRIDIFAEAAYRASNDIDVRSNLLPARLDVENEQFQVGVGLRLRFGN